MEVFLFPLVNVTLFPGTTRPLNVFEPRYIAMIKEAVKSRTPIALGYIEDPARMGPVQPGTTVPFVREVAGFGYAQIIEERINGTLLIFLQGQGKLRLGKVLKRNRPYIICEAKQIEEVTLLSPENAVALSSLYKILTRWIQVHIPDPSQRHTFMKNLIHPEEVVGSFASYLIRDYDLQQMALEFDDINDKVLFLHRLVESNELTA